MLLCVELTGVLIEHIDQSCDDNVADLPHVRSELLRQLDVLCSDEIQYYRVNHLWGRGGSRRLALLDRLLELDLQLLKVGYLPA